MSGKWHLGVEIKQDPFHRGFEHAYTLLQGGASHFDDEWMMYANYTPIYREDGKRVHVPPGFFSSRFYTDKLIEYIDSAKDGKPFFAYLALTAPHDPLHVPNEWLKKYKGRYDTGYDALRTERLARMKKIGIVPKDTKLSHRLPMIPKWDSLNDGQKRVMARRMELHAAMIENLDHHLGRLLNHLKQKKMYDNTLIIFFSDNGASPSEFHNYPGTSKEWVERNSDNRFENLGRRGSRISIGPAWALASNTPLRHFKAFMSEGGIRVPLIVAGPGVVRKGQIKQAFTHVMDIAPTLLEVAGASHPKKHQGRKVLPMLGKSMKPFLEGKKETVRNDSEAVGWELFGRRAIRQGRWKATWLDSPFGPNDWQLFDLEADVSERNDLANKKKKKLREFIQLWEDYSDSVGVILPLAIPKLGD
jgi:arylsulfatase